MKPYSRRTLTQALESVGLHFCQNTQQRVFLITDLFAFYWFLLFYQVGLAIFSLLFSDLIAGKFGDCLDTVDGVLKFGIGFFLKIAAAGQLAADHGENFLGGGPPV